MGVRTMHITMAMSAIARGTHAIDSANDAIEVVPESVRSNRGVMLPTQGCSLYKRKHPLIGA